jgi:hypothetical protein
MDGVNPFPLSRGIARPGAKRLLGPLARNRYMDGVNPFPLWRGIARPGAKRLRRSAGNKQGVTQRCQELVDGRTETFRGGDNNARVSILVGGWRQAYLLNRWASMLDG